MKQGGTYASVTGGVSEQVPHERREGQHKMQVNMVSDPVRGVARRHGSRTLSEAALSAYTLTDWNDLLDLTSRTKVLTFYVDGVEYDLVYRTIPTFVSTPRTFFAVRKDDGAIMTVVLGSGALMSALVSGGISAAVNIGRYIYLAGNTVTTAWTGVDNWSASANSSKLAVWVRGSAYSRKYSVTVTKTDNTKVTVSYTTVSSGYPGVLDTTDILATDPEYQKKVNDRVNDYNSDVTAWITTAANDVSVANIAQQLRNALTTAGFSVGRVEGTITINDANVKEVVCDDSGDNTLIRGVGNEVATPEAVSVVHYVGKVIRVRPKHSTEDDALYLKAVAKDKTSTGWADVYWQECAGYTATPTALFAMGTVSGTTLYIAGSPSDLNTLLPGDHPTFTPSMAGDLLNSPLPSFFGKRIDYLGEFQDRLIIGSGSTISSSKPGDYFNFFRASVLTVSDSDPYEVYALGSESDTIKSSVVFDRNLILFGERQQYSMNGRVPMTPQNCSIVASTAYEDAVDSTPVASGNFVFYCNTRGEAAAKTTALFQVQLGAVADSPESFNVSGQLDTFLSGQPVEIVTVTKPNCVVMRTSTSRNQLYTYTYLDRQDGTERVFDSWSRWEWSPSVGYIVGLSRYRGDILAYMVKEGLDSLGARRIWFSVERMTLRSDLSAYPYLDSLRPFTSTSGYLNGNSSFAENASVAFGSSGSTRFLGAGFAARSAFAVQYPAATTSAFAGINYDAYVTLTNPFVKDRNGKAILRGRLTLTRFLFSLRDTGAALVSYLFGGRTITSEDFNGRVVGDPSNIPNTQPIVTAQVSAPIGKETRAFDCTIASKRWLPLTITSIEWVGQFFNNVRQA